MPRPIDSKLHGVLDYTTGATLAALPSVLGLGGTRAGRVLRGAGVATTAYSLFTRYELGAVRKLPYRGHLALDTIAALGLAAAPWVLRTRDEGVRHWLPHVAVGAFELGAVALSDPSGGGADPVEQATSRVADTVSDTVAQVKDAAPTGEDERPKTVMPDGVEANDAMGARTIGVGTATGGGIGSGTAERSSPNAR